jgi:hypothetical protein
MDGQERFMVGKDWRREMRKEEAEEEEKHVCGTFLNSE